MRRLLRRLIVVIEVLAIGLAFMVTRYTDVRAAIFYGIDAILLGLGVLLVLSSLGNPTHRHVRWQGGVLMLPLGLHVLLHLLKPGWTTTTMTLADIGVTLSALLVAVMLELLAAPATRPDRREF